MIGNLKKKISPLIKHNVRKMYSLTRKKITGFDCFPLIRIEVSGKCNLSCIHCYRTMYDYRSKNDNLRFDLFAKIIDENVTYTPLDRQSLMLQGVGEPTLHPDFAKMIDYAKSSKKFHTIITTSNMLAVPVVKYDQYFDNGLDWIFVSIDSLNSQTIRASRRGTDVNRLMGNIKNVGNKHGDKVEFLTVLSKKNISELEAIANFLLSIGAIKWNIQPLQDMTSRHFLLNSEDVKLCNDVIETYRSRIHVNRLEIESFTRCRQPWESLCINSSGYVMPCSLWCDHNIINFGEVENENIYKIFNSEKFNVFRENMYKLRPEICNNCPFY